MSEPSGLYIRARIDPPVLLEAMRTAPIAVYDDWAVMGSEMNGASIRALTMGEYCKEMRESEFSKRDAGWRFTYNKGSNVFWCVKLLWSENWHEMSEGLSIIRHALREAKEGFALVQDFLFAGGETTGAVTFGGGTSSVVSAGGAQSFCDLASPVFDEMYGELQASYESGASFNAAEFDSDELDDWLP